MGFVSVELNRRLGKMDFLQHHDVIFDLLSLLLLTVVVIQRVLIVQGLELAPRSTLLLLG